MQSALVQSLPVISFTSYSAATDDTNPLVTAMGDASRVMASQKPQIWTRLSHLAEMVIHEVVNGLSPEVRPALGIIPMASGT